MANTAGSIGFLGAGQMATALASGFVRQGAVKPERLIASDPVEAARQRFVHETGGRTTTDNRQVVAESETVFLAVKPQQVPALLEELAGVLTQRHFLISIAAGVRIERLATGLGSEVRLVRVMPNTPCLVGQSASAYCLSANCTPEDAARVDGLLSCVGLAFALEEKLLDAVTGLSGSGPAFIYEVIEALSDGGVRMGLPRAGATALAAQTAGGAAAMVLATGKHPAVLKDEVASPGGTTIAGLQALEEGGMRGLLMKAVEAATRRSIELGKA